MSANNTVAWVVSTASSGTSNLPSMVPEMCFSDEVPGVKKPAVLAATARVAA
jgi:hypothetical protein